MRENLQRYGAALNTHHAIKVVAVLIMTVDHIGAYLYPDCLWLRAIGRIGFPVWFFLVGHARHYQIHRATLLWGLLLASLNPWLGEPVFPLNALFTIIFCQLLLREVESRQLLAREPWTLIAGCLVFLPLTFPLMEYGTLGLLYALMGYAVRSGQMNWRSGWPVTLVALAVFLAVQIVLFNFNTPQAVVVCIATAGMTWYLARFTHRPLSLGGTWFIEPIIVFLSRHSLQYYVIHRAMLQALGLALGALAYGFSWF